MKRHVYLLDARHLGILLSFGKGDCPMCDRRFEVGDEVMSPSTRPTGMWPRHVACASFDSRARR